jgi:hypothetical protein
VLPDAVLPGPVLPGPVLPDAVLPDAVLSGLDASDEPGEAFPLLCSGELPLLGDEPAGDAELVAGAVELLAEVTGVGFGVADVLACAVVLPQMVPAFCLAGFVLVPLGLALAVA